MGYILNYICKQNKIDCMAYLEHDIKGFIAVTTQLIEIEELFNHLNFFNF